MQALEGRDLHLWSVGIMVLLVVAADFAERINYIPARRLRTAALG
jgi:hypothetical protein